MSQEAGVEQSTAAATGGLALQVAGIYVSFGGVRALSDVSMSVAPGEVQGLIGPNGAGKTTLFDVISGLRDPDRGTIELDGVDITKRSVGLALAQRPAPHVPAPADLRAADGRGQSAVRPGMAGRRRGRGRRSPQPSKPAQQGAQPAPPCGRRVGALRPRPAEKHAGRITSHRTGPHGRVGPGSGRHTQRAAAR